MLVTCKIRRPEFSTQTLDSPGAEEARRCCGPREAPSSNSASPSSPLSSSSSSTSSSPSEVGGRCWCCGMKGTAAREGKWAAAAKGKGNGNGNGAPLEEAALLAPGGEAMARRLQSAVGFAGLRPSSSSSPPHCASHSSQAHSHRSQLS